MRNTGSQLIDWTSKRAVGGLYIVHYTVMLYLSKNIKLSCNRHAGAEGERKCRAYSFLPWALEWGEWSTSRPSCALPLGKDPRYALDRRLCRGSNPSPFYSRTPYWLSCWVDFIIISIDYLFTLKNFIRGNTSVNRIVEVVKYGAYCQCSKDLGDSKRLRLPTFVGHNHRPEKLHVLLQLLILNKTYLVD
jgi:hypothetical protein